jgi:hypothetical protein
VLKVEFINSHFGLATYSDALIIKPTDDRQSWVNVNPVVILSFIEGVLGYQRIESNGHNGWYFKRERGFQVQ